MRILFTIFLFFFFISSYSQTEIELEQSNGIYLVPCKVNEIPMKFILDTGASNVSISSTEALFLIKHGKIKDEDFIGKINYKIANGKILEGTQIILRTIDINGIILKDITATVVHELNAPLLLGQSALSKLGAYSINGNKLIIQNGTKNNYELEMEETYQWINEALSFHNISRDNIKISHDFSRLYEPPLIGYVLVINKDKTTNNENVRESYFVTLNEVVKVYLEKNEEISNTDNLVFEMNEDGNGILKSKSNSESLIRTYACVIELSKVNALFSKRLLNAIKNLLENNKNHLKETQKF